MHICLCLCACVTLMVILLEVTPTDGLLGAPCQNSGHSVLPSAISVGLHTGVKHSWHRRAGDTCIPEVPEHLLCQPHFLVLSPSLDVSSFCHIGILSHLCLSLPRGLPGTQETGYFPTFGVFFQSKTALLPALCELLAMPATCWSPGRTSCSVKAVRAMFGKPCCLPCQFYCIT